MNKTITKRTLLALFHDQRTIADRLEIDESGVSRWKMDAPIPEFHDLRLRHKLYPEIAWDRLVATNGSK